MERKQVLKDESVKVTEIVRLNHDSVALRFERPKSFDYYAGQFVMMWFDLKDSETFKVLGGADRRQKRAYSMSSSPINNEFIEITVKETPDGFVSKYIVNELKVGDELTITGPLGIFQYSEEIKEDIVLLGGGSGITPLLGILRYIADKKIERKAAFFYSNKTEEDIIWKEELEKLSQIENIDVINTLTRCEWDGECGRVSKEMIEKYVDNSKERKYFICGLPGFVDHCMDILEELEVPKENIKKEKYA